MCPTSAVESRLSMFKSRRPFKATVLIHLKPFEFNVNVQARCQEAPSRGHIMFNKCTLEHRIAEKNYVMRNTWPGAIVPITWALRTFMRSKAKAGRHGKRRYASLCVATGGHCKSSALGQRLKAFHQEP